MPSMESTTSKTVLEQGGECCRQATPHPSVTTPRNMLVSTFPTHCPCPYSIALYITVYVHTCTYIHVDIVFLLSNIIEYIYSIFVHTCAVDTVYYYYME